MVYCTNDEIMRLGILWLTSDGDRYNIQRQMQQEAAGDQSNTLWNRFGLNQTDGLTWANLWACRSKYKKVTERRVRKFLETEIAISNVKGEA